METIAQKAKRLLEPIPDVNWCMFKHTNSKDQCCGRGHLYRILSDNPNDYTLNNLMEATRKIIDGISVKDWVLKFENYVYKVSGNVGFVVVNDTQNTKYQESTPKARVLHLLDDMIKAGY